MPQNDTTVVPLMFGKWQILARCDCRQRLANSMTQITSTPLKIGKALTAAAKDW